jgi:hypothetical protein
MAVSYDHINNVILMWPFDVKQETEIGHLQTELRPENPGFQPPLQHHQNIIPLNKITGNVGRISY